METSFPSLSNAQIWLSHQHPKVQVSTNSAHYFPLQQWHAVRVEIPLPYVAWKMKNWRTQHVHAHIHACVHITLAFLQNGFMMQKSPKALLCCHFMWPQIHHPILATLFCLIARITSRNTFVGLWGPFLLCMKGNLCPCSYAKAEPTSYLNSSSGCSHKVMAN